jgi:hypothetical protein
MSYDIKHELKHELKTQFDFIKSLPKQVKLSIRDYTGAESDVVNESLRERIPLNDYHQNMLNDIDYAFENVPKLTEPLTVYRRIRNFPSGKSFDIKKMISIISASYDKDFVSKFKMECCVLIITLPVGSSVLPIEELSNFPDEKEILLNRKGLYYITSEGKQEYKTKKGDTFQSYTYHISYVPENSEKV